MQLNDIPKETKKTWFIPEGLKYSPKDVEMLYIATCLGGETGELLNKLKKTFRKKYYTEAHTEDNLDQKINEEVADVLFYVSRLADLLGIDMEKELSAKMQENARRYGLTKK